MTGNSLGICWLLCCAGHRRVHVIVYGVCVPVPDGVRTRQRRAG